MEDALSSFVSKWSGVPISNPAVASLRSIDETRLTRGKNPLTDSQTQRGIMAAQTRQPGVGSTPMPERNPWSLWSNASADITQLVKGIPQLPMALVNEFQQITTGNPVKNVEQVGDWFDQPGIRLLPGAFVASALLPGGMPASEIGVRPVSAALDVLPYSQGVVKANAARALKKYTPESASAPNTRVGTVTSGDRAINIIKEWPGRGGGKQMPIQDRFGLQAAIAATEGKRLIPDMFVNRVEPLRDGAAILERPWRTSFAGTDLGQRAFEFSGAVRDLQSKVKGLESNEVLKGREKDAFVGGSRLHQKFIEEFGEGSKATADWGDIHRAITDPDSFTSPKGLTPEDVVGQLPPAHQKYVHEYLDLEKTLEKQLLAPPDPTRPLGQQPYIGRWDDGKIYLHKDIQRLQNVKDLRAKWNDKVAEPELIQRLGEAIDSHYEGLTRLAGRSDAEALLRDSYPDWRRRLQTLNEFEGIIDEVGKFANGGRGTPYHLMAKGAVEEAARTSTTGASKLKNFRETYQRTGGVHRSFDKTVARVTPATESATGSRLMYKMFQDNLKIATKLQDEWAVSRPHVLREFDELKAVYAELNVPNIDPGKRAMLQQKATNLRVKLMDEVGGEYRYLHYTTPRDPNWINWDTEIQRQNMASLITKQERNKLYADTRAELAIMREKGYDPTYVPGVAKEKAADVDMTTVSNTYKSPSFAKERSFDYAPMSDDLGVAVSYASIQDYLSRAAIPHMIQMINEKFGIRGPELDAMIHAQAQASWARRTDLHTTVGYKDFERTFTNKMKDGAKSRYIQFNPNEMFPFVKESPSASNLDQVWLPREMASVLEKSFKDSNNFFQKVFEPVTNTFRVSVLLFSPAWHWNNLFSNGLITTLANPRAWLEVADQYRKMGGWEGIKEAATTQDLRTSGTAAGTRGVGVYDDAMEVSGLTGTTGVVENLAIGTAKKRGVHALNNNMSRTKTGARILDRVQESKGAQVTTSAFHKMTQGSLGVNAFFDDLARRTNFAAFYKQKHADLLREAAEGGKVLSPDDMMKVAGEHALRQTQDWIMDWTQLLPVERGILRAVFPFYSFMSHILRAAVKFPFDHPLRVSIINAFTRAENEDWQSRYPQIFRRLLGMPVGDDDAEWTAFNVDSFNPFRDIGNMMSLGFFASSTNPILQTALEGLGVDPMSGAPEYAPNFVYDPLSPSGQTFVGKNPVINLAANLIPQGRAIAQWMGLDADFREYELADPEGAHRALLSGLRMPTIWRNIDVNDKVARDEIKRFNDYRTSISEMDVGRLGRYDKDLAQTVQSLQTVTQTNPAFSSMSPQQAAKKIVEDGGVPYNPLSSFVTV